MSVLKLSKIALPMKRKPINVKLVRLVFLGKTEQFVGSMEFCFVKVKAIWMKGFVNNALMDTILTKDLLINKKHFVTKIRM